MQRSYLSFVSSRQLTAPGSTDNQCRTSVAGLIASSLPRFSMLQCFVSHHGNPVILRLGFLKAPHRKPPAVAALRLGRFAPQYRSFSRKLRSSTLVDAHSPKTYRDPGTFSGRGVVLRSGEHSCRLRLLAKVVMGISAFSKAR